PRPAGSVRPLDAGGAHLDYGAGRPRLDRDVRLLQHGLANRRAEPVLQLRRGAVTRTLGGQELLELLVEAVLGQARLTLIEVALQQLAPGRVTLVVQEEPHLRQHLRAVRLVRPTAAHEETSCPRRKPRSRAVSVRMSRSWRRPRCSRDITVPIGVPMISAISLYAKPSTSARYTAMRNSSGMRCSASFTSESGRWSSASASADRSPADVCDSARASCQSSISSER